MSKEKKRGVLFFLFGCSPMTLLVLLGVLAGMVLLPPLISIVIRRTDPPEPRFYRLPHVREGWSWIMVEGTWRFRVDANDDGEADCFVRVASGRDFFEAADYKGLCVGGAPRLLALVHGKLPMSEEMRGALDQSNEFKLERGWLTVSVIDTNDDGLADCVLDRMGGVIARREGRSCPGDAVSIPTSLETHERRLEFEQLFQLENAVRRHVLNGLD